MECNVAKCDIRQMQRELRNFEFILSELEQVVDNPRGSELAYFAHELKDNRKYFNYAFRSLLRELEK